MKYLVAVLLIQVISLRIKEDYCFKVCKIKLRDRWQDEDITIHLYPEDPFQVAKTVAPWNGSFMSVSTLFALEWPHKSEANYSKELISDCMSIYQITQGALKDDLVLEVTSRSVLNHMYRQDESPSQLQKGLRNILHEFEGMTIIYMSSSFPDETFLPKASRKLYFNIEDGNSTLESIYRLTDTKVLILVIVCSADCILDILHQASFIKAEEIRTTRWIVIPSDCTCATDFTGHSTNIPSSDIITVDTDLCMDKLSNDSCLNIYKLESMRKIDLQRVGCIDKTGSIESTKIIFSGIRNNFNGRSLTVATLEWPPFVLKRFVNKTIIYEGVCMELLSELSGVLNFTYTIVEPEDGLWGDEVNGTWSGLVGLMAYNKVDLVAAPLISLAPREQVMDFTVSYVYQRSGIILKSPDSNSNKWLTLVAPFRIEVHICILFSLILSTIFLFMVEEVNPGNIWTDNRLSARRTRYGAILWCHFGALMANGGAYLPHTQSGRTILSCWWLLTVISAATYSGNLIAFLTDWREKLPFTSLAEMVDQDTYSWGVLGGTASTNIFKGSKRDDYQRIWNQMQTNPNLLSEDIDDHKKMLDAGNYAYLGDEDIYSAWKSQDCRFHMIEDGYMDLYYRFGLPNNSIHTSVFSEMILQIYEMGLPGRWYKKWKPQFECETDRTAKRVDVLGLQSIFYAAGIGIVLAIVVLAVELKYK